MPTWVDYKTLRQELKFADLLEHYQIEINAKNGQHKGPCPLISCKDEGDSKPTFSANLERGIWQCFKCGAKGNQVEFGVIMEGLNPDDRKEFRKGALILAKRFGLARENENKKYRKPRTEFKQEPAPQFGVKELINQPLNFTLKTIDPTHPWFTENGLLNETVEHFGLGYCSRGFLKGRIAIPLHNFDGDLVGYAGLLMNRDEINKDNPLLLLPETKTRDGVRHVFDPSLVLYNANRLSVLSHTVLLVKDILLLWHMWQDGATNVVSLISEEDRVLDESLADVMIYEFHEYRR